MKALQIIGILNVTPDSYYDGGRFVSLDKAIERAGILLQEGADWIEIGGESTGPNAKDVSSDEECSRTIPVINALRTNFPQANISIDTYKADVARAAIQAGATMVNDVTAGRACSLPLLRGRVRERVHKRTTLSLALSLQRERENKEGGLETMFNIIKNTEAHVVLMYSKDNSPRTTIQNVQYKDVVRTVKEFLSERKDAAVSAGISLERIILDPGMGHFVSSDPTYSFALIARLAELHDLGCPILLSPSRKSFLAGRENLSPSDRLPGTIAASAIAVLNGASYIRTHDVKEVRRGCEITCAIRTSPQ